MVGQADPEIEARRPRRRRITSHNYGGDKPIPQVEAYFRDLTEPLSKHAQNQDATGEMTDGELTDEQAGGMGDQHQRNKMQDDEEIDMLAAQRVNSSDEEEEEHAGAANLEESKKKKKRDMRRGSTRVVTDPITYRKVKITNTDADIDKAVDPKRAGGTSILDRAFPPMEWDRAISGYRNRLFRYSLLMLIPTLIMAHFLPFFSSIISSTLWCASLWFHLNRVATSEWLDHKWDMERRRGREHTREQRSIGKDWKGEKGKRRLERVGGDEADVQEKRESVEWANSLLKTLWPIIDPKRKFRITHYSICDGKAEDCLIMRFALVV